MTINQTLKAVTCIAIGFLILLACSFVFDVFDAMTSYGREVVFQVIWLSLLVLLALVLIKENARREDTAHRGTIAVVILRRLTSAKLALPHRSRQHPAVLGALRALPKPEADR